MESEMVDNYSIQDETFEVKCLLKWFFNDIVNLTSVKGLKVILSIAFKINLAVEMAESCLNMIDFGS